MLFRVVAGGVLAAFCRPSTLPLALFFAPIPPTRARRALFPAGRGDLRLLFSDARGFAPRIPGPTGRHWRNWGTVSLLLVPNRRHPTPGAAMAHTVSAASGLMPGAGGGAPGEISKPSPSPEGKGVGDGQESKLKARSAGNQNPRTPLPPPQNPTTSPERKKTNGSAHILHTCRRRDAQLLAAAVRAAFRDKPLPLLANGLCARGATEGVHYLLIEDVCTKAAPDGGVSRTGRRRCALIVCPEEKDCVRLRQTLERFGLRAAFYTPRDLSFLVRYGIA